MSDLLTSIQTMSAEAWSDPRPPADPTLEAIVEEVRARAAHALGGAAPELPAGAGHDARVLAAKVPTAMPFVQNPTLVSHRPDEHASDETRAQGARARRVLDELAWR